MREYETTVIIQPEISEEGSKTILERLDGILEKHGDVRLMCEDVGKRKLAYEIRKFQKGHYYMLSYLGEGKAVPELERTLRLDESVLRFLTIQVDEEVVDVEARKARATEFERQQAQRAAEKAEREAEEEKARQEADAAAEEERARRAAENEAAAKSEAAAVEAQGEAPSEEKAAEAVPEKESGDDVKVSADEVGAAGGESGDRSDGGESAAGDEGARGDESADPGETEEKTQ